jgi:sialate O-acetylesterase
MRLLAIDRTSSIQPLEQVHGTWQACTSQTAAEFSAVGYFFGRELVQQTYVPIGLVMVAWGGKAAEPFVQIQALLQEPDLVPYVQHAREKASTYEADLKYYHEHKLEILSTWKKEALAAKARGLRHRLKPQPPAAPDAAVWPQNIWNGMVHPLLKMPITGVIWYQGESNTNKPFVYRTLLKTLITDWRSQWQQGDFPFYIVQLANYKAPQSQPAEDSPWAMLRESQAVACALLRTGLAVAIDIGEADTIHPPNKQEVGRRLSLLALHDVYGMDVDFAGPTFERMMIHGQSAVLYFKHAQGLHTPDDQSVAGFAIAGENQKFHWAQGVIDGSTMVLTSKAVPKPVAVRYGWANNPKVNLYNQSGLPATPFRTDNWE